MKNITPLLFLGMATQLAADRAPNFVLVYVDETTIGEMLKASERNYVTAIFGKGASAMGRFDEAGYDVTDECPGEAGGNGNGHGSYCDPKKKTPFRPDLEARKKALLKELNEKLIKNEVNKEKSRRYVSSQSWRESPRKLTRKKPSGTAGSMCAIEEACRGSKEIDSTRPWGRMNKLSPFSF